MPTAAEPFGVVRDRAVYLPDTETLVAADLHLGTVAASAVDAPLEEGPAIVDRLAALVERFEPAELVLAGDVLHAFGFVPQAARETVSALVQRVEAVDAALVLLEGNHDAQLAELSDLQPAGSHQLGDGTVVCHGHERPAETGHRYVVGHDHPVIVIDGRRWPCYLHGQAAEGEAEVLALPAFNAAVRGTPVNDWADGDPLSPFLTAVSEFQPVVWDHTTDDALVFPALASLQTHL